MQEIRQVFDGTIALTGAISTGAQIAAALLMGADIAYLGTRFIAAKEAIVPQGYKTMIATSSAADIVDTLAISGVNANFLRPSIIDAGLDPDHLEAHGGLDMQTEAKVWKTIWSAGQDVGAIRDQPGARALCDRCSPNTAPQWPWWRPIALLPKRHTTNNNPGEFGMSMTNGSVLIEIGAGWRQSASIGPRA